MPVPLGQWTDERIADLKRYAEEGYSCSQIAGLLGNATRNSVIGKLHRLGLRAKSKRGEHLFKKTKKLPRPRVPKTSIFATRWGAAETNTKPPLNFAELRVVDLIPLHIAFGNLEFNSCRFPFGEGPYTFCGHDTLGLGSYCDQHHLLVYHHPEGRGPRPDRAALNRQRFPKMAVLHALEEKEEAA